MGFIKTEGEFSERKEKAHRQYMDGTLKLSRLAEWETETERHDRK